MAGLANSSVPFGPNSATASSRFSTTDSSVARWPASSEPVGRDAGADRAERVAERRHLGIVRQLDVDVEFARGRAAPDRCG